MMFRTESWVLLPVAIALAGCPNPNVTASDPTIAEAEGGTADALCQNAQDRENPLIIEWPGTQKVDLESVSKRGLVIVSYQGCKLRVLPRCEVGGAYRFEPVTPHRDTLEIKNDDDLFSKLPVGAQNLKAELASGKALKLDYVMVGQQLAEAPPASYDGGCDGATHYVRTIALGAYDMNTAARASGAAGIDIGILEAGGSSKASRSRLRHSGDVEACAGKTDINQDNVRTYGCSAPVQLGLAPLTR